jgi:hypothetical protein
LLFNQWMEKVWFSTEKKGGEFDKMLDEIVSQQDTIQAIVSTQLQDSIIEVINAFSDRRILKAILKGELMYRPTITTEQLSLEVGSIPLFLAVTKMQFSYGSAR